MLCKWSTTHPRVIVSLSCRHRAREPEDGLRRRERPSVGNVFRRGAVSNRRVSEEPCPPADLHGGETYTFPRQHCSGGFHFHALTANLSNVLLCSAPPFFFPLRPRCLGGRWEVSSPNGLSASWYWWRSCSQGTETVADEEMPCDNPHCNCCDFPHNYIRCLGRSRNPSSCLQKIYIIKSHL